MVSELADEGAMPSQLPAPASRRLENAEPRFRFRRQIHRGSSLRRGVSPPFNLSAVFLQSSIDGSSRSRSVEISRRVLVNPQLAVFNRTSWSRSVKRSSAELVNPLFDSVCIGRSPAIPVQRLSKRRTRKKKQLIASIREFAPEKSQGERRVWNLKKRVGELRSEIEAATVDIKEAKQMKESMMWSRSMMKPWSTWSSSMINLCCYQIMMDINFAEYQLRCQLRGHEDDGRGVLDITATEVADYLVGGVMATRSRYVNTNSHSIFLKPEPFLSLYFFPCISISFSLNMMYYERFIQVHREKDADITVAEMPMDEKHVIAFGLMKSCEEGRNIELAEKPKGEQLKAMKVDTTTLGGGALEIELSRQLGGTVDDTEMVKGLVLDKKLLLARSLMSVVKKEGTHEVICTAYELVRRRRTVAEEEDAVGPENVNYVTDTLQKEINAPISEFEMVILEAARAITELSDVTSWEITQAINVLQLFLRFSKPVLQFAAVYTLNKVAMTHPMAVTICKAMVWTIPSVYVKAGSALLEIIQAKPCRIPLSFLELFSILDDASERTFLCAGTAEACKNMFLMVKLKKLALI
nr:ADP-glucose pyrophosphorylase small subunit [Ipomoea batatas]